MYLPLEELREKCDSVKCMYDTKRALEIRKRILREVKDHSPVAIH
jgi:hypothetical protein